MNNDFNQNYNGQDYNNNQGYYNQGYGAQPEDPRTAAKNYIDGVANSVFGKALAAAIMMEFPITSVIAIFMGASVNSTLNELNSVAQNYGVKGNGKYIAARVLSKIGLFAGIGMSVFWALYFLIFVFIGFAEYSIMYY